MFSEATQTWFDGAFPSPTPVQERGWAAIATGRHALLVAPTGSGKTLAAFLFGIDALARREPAPDDAAGTRVLYVSPLKALVYDIERNLRVPLAGIRRTAERLGTTIPTIEVAVRTGDTPQRERQRQLRAPGDILVTTPESLFLILGSRARETLSRVETVIVDEVHALAPTKRGAHLALSLERLADVTEREPQRIGLSATVRPLDEMAAFVAGTRPIEIVDASMAPRLDLTVTVPVPDMTNVAPPPQTRSDGEAPANASWNSMIGGSARRGGPILAEIRERTAPVPPPERGIWSALYPQILEEIRGHRSTIVFVNSRGLCERLARRLNELAGEELVRAHHGSVSHEKRAEIEEGLKAGRIRGIVATSSLELGIDMGALDRVILVESPGSVARGLQRVGRAGHDVGATSVGRIYPKFKGDLLESAVVAERMLRGDLERVRMPENALDVLAQQIVAMCCDRERAVDEIDAIVRRATPYRNLTRAGLESVLDMLSGRYPSADFADLRPLLRWDRATDRLSARRGTVMVSRMNPGTIPDRGAYPVMAGPDGPRVGELDEEMVFESRVGDVFLLGASAWRVEEITRDRVVASPAPGEPGRLPFWHGDGVGRPMELGRAIGAFTRELAAVPREEAEAWIRGRSPLDRFAARNLADYVHDQRAHAGVVPTDTTIVVERFRDELGDWRVCILTPFGARVHAPWATAIQRLVSAESGMDVQISYADDGITLRVADVEDPLPVESLVPDSDDVETLVTEQLADTSLFAGLFRENAVRSLLVPRRRPTQRNPLWAQRLKSQQLFASVRRHASFPIVLETYRQALADVFDIRGLQEVLSGIRSRQIRVAEVETRSASPFARSLVFAFVTQYLYEQDSPVAERRAQALTLDRALLAELLGRTELRELIDRDVLAELERALQCVAPDRRARDADELHDLLRRLGDLTANELEARATADPADWLEALGHQRRAIPVSIAGETRWIVAEEAGLYRDALGVQPPAGVPAAFLDPVASPIEALVRRYARTHGPFAPGAPAARFGLTIGQLAPVLAALVTDGTLVFGEIRPDGVEGEYCDADVLRRLKRRTLAVLRNAVTPTDLTTYARFLVEWHGIGGESAGPDALMEVLVQLESLPLCWSELCEVILPARVRDFVPSDLDVLTASGSLVWVGRGALGPRDGRISIHRRDAVPETGEASHDASPGAAAPSPLDAPLHRAILSALDTHGASFAVELERAARAEVSDATAAEIDGALWDLVWAGLVTNDTFVPLRELRGTSRARGSRRPPRRAHTWASTRGRLEAGAFAGRWSLVSTLGAPRVSDTERVLATAHELLQRYGIVSREVAAVEALEGGFGTTYRVLRAMEESGRVQRGYFVEGLSGGQFAFAGAVDRLRALDEAPTVASDREAAILVLAATDPANVYGGLVPWPDGPDGAPRPRRVPGAYVALRHGRLVLYVGPGGRQMLTFTSTAEGGEVIPRALDAVRKTHRAAGRRRLRVETIDGLAVRDSPRLPWFEAAGFQVSYRSLLDAAL